MENVYSRLFRGAVSLWSGLNIKWPKHKGKAESKTIGQWRGYKGKRYWKLKCKPATPRFSLYNCNDVIE